MLYGRLHCTVCKRCVEWAYRGTCDLDVVSQSSQRSHPAAVDLTLTSKLPCVFVVLVDGVDVIMEGEMRLGPLRQAPKTYS